MSVQVEQKSYEMPPRDGISIDRLQKAATSDQQLFEQMTELYPHWVANQSWLMFGFPQP
jgi:hypothetical protein